MNEARERILDRVRLAVRRKAHRRDAHGPPKPWFPSLAADTEALSARFQQEHERLKGEFHRVRDVAAARNELSNICDRESFKKIAASDEPLLRDVLQGREVRWVTANSEAGASLESFDVGVTRADALAARTGSILLSSRSGTGRALSVLPPVHLVIAAKEELVVDLSDGLKVWQRKYGASLPSNCFIISGPSRTADIEKTLVLGAHGPRRVMVLLIG